MKLTYIFHSGFALEFEHFSIIIDYFEDSAVKNGIVHESLLKKDLPLYVLSSHSHHDHFNPEILTWKESKRNITYIFSKDILDNKMANKDDAIYLDKLDEFSDKNLEIKAYGSTDLGISFYIKADDKTIFHAGDLNNWHWNEESTQDEIKEAENFYQTELSILSKDVKEIDLAMFPIDPRLGKDFMLGANQFLEAIKVDILSPMHFSSDPSKIIAFKSIADQHNCKYICWNKRGESISI